MVSIQFSKRIFEASDSYHSERSRFDFPKKISCDAGRDVQSLTTSVADSSFFLTTKCHKCNTLDLFFPHRERDSRILQRFHDPGELRSLSPHLRDICCFMPMGLYTSLGGRFIGCISSYVPPGKYSWCRSLPHSRSSIRFTTWGCVGTLRYLLVFIVLLTLIKQCQFVLKLLWIRCQSLNCMKNSRTALGDGCGYSSNIGDF